MRTELAPGLVIDTKGYDVVEALEKGGDMEMADWKRSTFRIRKTQIILPNKLPMYVNFKLMSVKVVKACS